MSQRDSDANDKAWANARMDCPICSHHWIAIYPTTAVTLECPGCGYDNPVPAR